MIHEGIDGVGPEQLAKLRGLGLSKVGQLEDQSLELLQVPSDHIVCSDEWDQYHQSHRGELILVEQ